MPSKAVAEKPPESRGLFCPGCGDLFIPRRKEQRFCSANCRKQSYNKKQKLSRPFVALDGEGIGNKYVLLAAKRIGKENAHTYNRNGLSTEECFRFLLGLTQGRKAGVKPLYVWFAFDYDVNMMLGDLPLKGDTASIEELRATNSTVWRGYKITYIPRKIFKLSCNGRYFHSTDTWGFFQATFEKALEDWGINVPAIITRGKNARQDFSTWSEADIVAYNDAELDCMSEIMEKLRDSISPLSLPVRSWHGPGALAGSWLAKQKAKAYKGEIPQELTDAAIRAYFGGRIDVKGYGFVDPVYHYDIVSAYPSAIRFLPDLSSLEWKYAEGNAPPDEAGISVSRIRWRIQETKWGAFPWRNRQGSIRWPLAGEGWYWQREIDAAIERFGPESVEYLATWHSSGEIVYPFKDAIEEAFSYRRELKAQGLSSHIAVKLILNSLYGKFAQTVGKAQYYSPIWAGLITSYTRAELQRAISEEVVCVMTDSIWTRVPLSVNTSADLGAWEEQSEGKLILAGAGLYEAHKADGSKIIWQRGFDKRRPLDIEGIVSHWLKDDPLYEGKYSINRFVGMGLASVTHYPWRHWIDLERKVQPVPFVGTTKRLPLYPIIDEREPGNVFHALDLRPADDGECSYPYSKLTLDPENLVDKLAEECAD